MSSMMSFGPTAYPTLKPVRAKFFEKPPRTIVLSYSSPVLMNLFS